MPPSSIGLISQTETNSDGALVPTENTSDSNESQGSSLSQVLRISSRNNDEALKRLPSSPKELILRIDRQRNEIRLLQEENLKLKSREVEVSALTLKLQQQFAATQNQVANLKRNIQLQLVNPITEDEYNTIDALPEAKRDLLDTVKLGIYRQIGSLQASAQAAARRAAELGTSLHQLTEENKSLKIQILELQSTLEFEKQSSAKELKEVGNQRARILELEASVKDMEGRLKGAFLDQEQFLTAKLTAQMKMDEVARLSIQLEEAELDLQRYKANAECSEQKLDILKSEYYELKLNYSQRNLELESSLKAANEKLKTLGDLEMESELFISNLASRIPEESISSVHTRPLLEENAANRAGGLSAKDTTDYESWLALPRSRKLAHSLTVTKRCLHLENKVSSLEHDVTFKERQIERLRVSLSSAREALNKQNSPYAIVEKTVEELYDENEALKERLRISEVERRHLAEKLQTRTREIEVLCKHRGDLLKMKSLLSKIGVVNCGNDVVKVEHTNSRRNSGNNNNIAKESTPRPQPVEMDSFSSTACPGMFAAIHITS
ncbi:unnamed protein product [Phytomonas sp. Hart1]|nr:unnamed protein product [Phytomonas sp. Hart1]|eukprot:CCW71173.1 unnamed protein product [Phytomonas sp. isolate Hart1]